MEGPEEHPDDVRTERPRFDADGDSFGGLADATRLAILDVLARTDGAVAYADLFERTPVEDEGRFNYHLRQLRERYVRQDEGGYARTQSGVWASNLLAAGVLDDAVDRPFREVDSVCGRCGTAAVEVGYRDGEGVVRCRDCGEGLTRFDFPPGAAQDLPLDAFVDAYDRRTRAYVGLADDGVCPFCGHETTTELRPAAARRPDGLPVVCECSRCSAGLAAPLGLVLANRSRVAAALHDRGVDPDGGRFWEREWCTFSAPSVHGTDPLVVALEVEEDGGTEGHDGTGDADGGTVRFLVDADVELMEIER